MGIRLSEVLLDKSRGFSASHFTYGSRELPQDLLLTIGIGAVIVTLILGSILVTSEIKSPTELAEKPKIKRRRRIKK